MRKLPKLVLPAAVVVAAVVLLTGIGATSANVPDLPAAQQTKLTAEGQNAAGIALSMTNWQETAGSGNRR